ncbi:FAD-dependent oxidoreductase [Planctomyces sp. SH-PL62]|uniref:FAD-dependent oxidoreductase n=1 Tax=Planctomyces sp. SH-PL62 TaxID=1636152 RepID=UPI00078BBABB|nr:FAD-dependent oxidoreductase [Planctomyces sp. SH-PL62]AMV39516.1 Coenzyme A disulfide reductase [Planctomyces sp. SH-PL62]
MKLVIIGGVAGGASAATRARRLSETAEIVMLERGPDVSFANCGLPYYIGGEIEEREKLLVAKPSLLRQRYRIDVRTRTEAIAVDRGRKIVTALNLADGSTFEESYDALILAPGAAPWKPPIAGADLPGVFTLRNLEDVDRIKAIVDRGIEHAVVVGAGYIGLELAENFLRRGLRTTVVELQDQVVPVVDCEMATPMTEALRSRGATLLLKNSVEAIHAAGGGLVLDLKSGDRLEAGLVVLGVGVRPENRLALEAGLDVGPRGGIQVDDRMRTNDPSIYAVGDAVETVDFVTRRPAQIPLAGPANRQGRIAADNVFGRESRYRGTQATAIVGFFDQTLASTGQTQKALDRDGSAYIKVYVHANHHAGYYPGAKPLSIKILMEPGSGKLLGAQVAGSEGVDNRINVLATAIQAGMTVRELQEVELAYAPQFGSAKDPVNMAGFVATNILDGRYPQIQVEELDGAAGAEAVVIDVRTPKEVAAGAIPGAVNVPIDELRERLGEIPRDRPVVAYCQVGMRGYMATLILRDAGVDAYNLGGGYKTYLLHHPASNDHV